MSTPFLDEFRFLDEPPATGSRNNAAQSTPFISTYQLEDEVETIDAEAEEYAQFLAELEDEQLEEALADIADEFAELYESESYSGDIEGAQRTLEMELEAPLGAIEAYLESTGTALDNAGLENLTDEEIDTIVEGSTAEAELSPAFENLFGVVKRIASKVGKAAKKALKHGVTAVATLGLKPIFAGLKKVVPLLVRRWLGLVLKHVPAELQPLARTVASRLGMPLKAMPAAPVAPSPTTLPALSAPVANGSPVSGVDDAGTAAAMSEPTPSSAEPPAASDGVANAGDAVQAPAGPDAAQLVDEFSYQIADLVFAQNAAEQEYAAALSASSYLPAADPIGDLDRARNELTDQFLNLAENEDAAPHIERFLPAVLPLAIRVIGRKRVSNVLASAAAAFLKNLTGQQNMGPLARVLVDKGLRLVAGEASSDDDQRGAAGALTQTVEDAARRVAEAPQYVLDNEALLEAYTLEALEQSAAAHLPVLTEQAYAARPDLRETHAAEGFWTWGGPKGQHRYKKFTRVFDVELTPQMAQAITSFESVTLASFVRDQLGLNPGQTIRCKVHLYEALPGATLAGIGRSERNVPGLGTGVDGRLKLHPLTPAIAGILLREPRLGRPIAPALMAHRSNAAIGGRYYYLEIPGARLRLAATGTGRPRVRRSTHLKLKLDFAAREIRARLFLSEADAQEIAGKLRGKGSPGQALTNIRSVVERGLSDALSGASRGLRVVHASVPPKVARGMAIRLFSGSTRGQVLRYVRDSLLKAAGELFASNAQSFISAGEHDADGLTVSWRLEAPQLLSTLGSVFRGKAPLIPASAIAQPAPSTVIVHAGFRRD